MRTTGGSLVVAIFCVPVMLLACSTFVLGGSQMITGGACTYKQYQGQATITSITPVMESSGTAGKKYLVTFSFTTNEEVQEEFARTEGKEFELRLVNSTYPGPRFLQKYDIRVGKVFDGVMKVIVKGTCTPWVFEFPSIKLDDYFENRT